MAKRSSGRDLNKWNPSQVVAHNMTKARELRGLTQTEVAERLTRFTETKWSKTSVAQAEGSISGARIRAFTAVELVALARTFDLPVTYFLAPPEDRHSHFLDLPGVPSDAWEYFVMLIAGHEHNAEIVGRQYANDLTTNNVDIPRSDLSPDEIDQYTDMAKSEQRLDPSDIMAAAFHGLMLTHTRGAPPAAGDTLENWIGVLESLQLALRAFQGYKPGRFVNPQMAQEIAARREAMLEIDRQVRKDDMRLWELERDQTERERLEAEGGGNEQKD